MKNLPMVKAPEKPAYGETCNGCGFCCAAEPCAVAKEFLKATEGPCPAMEFSIEDSRFYCGMMTRPGYHLGLATDIASHVNRSMGNLFAMMLGAGRGCDSELAQ